MLEAEEDLEDKTDNKEDADLDAKDALYLSSIKLTHKCVRLSHNHHIIQIEKCIIGINKIDVENESNVEVSY